MSRRFAVVTILAGFRLLLGADGDCLRYEPARVRLNGTLVSHQGLRGWWAVKPDNPICTIKEPSDPAAVAYSGVSEVQLILMGGQTDFDRYRLLLGRKVSVSGKLTPQVTAYHQTEVLILVDGIEAARAGSDAPTSAPTRPPSSSVSAVGGYAASVTVVPRPVNRVIKQAWDKDPNHFFPDSDRYVEHMFNGPMDIMWVKCRDGYSITGPKSSTGSSVFQMDPADPKNPYWGVAVSDSERTNITVLCSKVAADPSPTGWVFPSSKKHGKDVMLIASENWLKRVLKPVAAALGFQVTLHIFRRGFATLAHASGATLRDIQEQLRHASAATTANVYVQSVPESVRQTVEKMDRALRKKAIPAKEKV